jgi:hypothetical protein
LSISQGIIKDYNGSIEVEIEVGQETFFKMSSPTYTEEKYGAQQ